MGLTARRLAYIREQENERCRQKATESIYLNMFDAQNVWCRGRSVDSSTSRYQSCGYLPVPNVVERINHPKPCSAPTTAEASTSIIPVAHSLHHQRRMVAT
eukprot:scaffold59478_cov70-Attheya_sp.AAC.4